jgi:hypothetical protein
MFECLLYQSCAQNHLPVPVRHAVPNSSLGIDHSEREAAIWFDDMGILAPDMWPGFVPFGNDL